MFWGDAVDPDYGVAIGYLGVDRPTAGISIESTLLESEDVHEEPLGSLHVLVHSQGDDRLGFHARIFFYLGCIVPWGYKFVGSVRVQPRLHNPTAFDTPMQDISIVLTMNR